MVTLNPFTIQMIVSGILPILLGFVMNSTWSTKIKANVGIVAAAAVTLLTNAINETGVAFLSWEMLEVFFLGLAIQLATYNGYYKGVLDPNAKLPNLIPSKSK